MHKVRAQIVSNKKLLACSEEYFLYYSKGNLYFKKEKETKLQLLGSALKGKDKILAKCRLLERLFRNEPRCAIAIDRDTFLVSWYGGIYKVSVSEKSIVREHSYRNGMRNALNLCKIDNINGFRDCVVYGEYFGNVQKEEVRIFARYEDEKWNCVYTFEKGRITHIHSIVAHPKRGSIIVLTGDQDTESIVCEITNDFQHSQVWAEGKQQYRACVAFPYENGILYATDTPLEKNSIYYMEKKETGDLSHKKLQELPGPCIYGTEMKGQYVFATSVEPDPTLSRWRYMITYKLGAGVQSRKTNLFMGDYKKGFEKIFEARKDIFPMLLFQFGNFQFPTGTKELYITGQSVCGLDGKTVNIEYE